MTTQPLRQSIIETLTFFDLFRTPLTREEVYRFLWRSKASRGDVYMALEEMVERDSIHTRESLYYLPGSSDYISARAHSYPIILEKLRIARRAAKILRYIPHVRAMFVCNTVAFGAARRESDIDVFIVIDDGRLWLTRFLITSVLGLFRMRRTKRRVANKICLSFFVTTSAVGLHDITIDAPDIYLAYWIAELFPIYDPDNVERLIQKNNTWARDLLPHALQPTNPSPYVRVDDSPRSHMIKRFFEKTWRGNYGDMLEEQAKRIQQTKMKLNTSSVQHEHTTHVIVNDTMMKFHENDRRAMYRDAWDSTVKRHTSHLT